MTTTATTTDTAPATPTTRKRAPRKPAPLKATPTASKPRKPKPTATASKPRKATPVAPVDRFTALWSAYHTHQARANEAFAAAMSILNPVPIELPPNTPMTRPW